jgi:alpha-ketoglutarate-dependent taurine dioxygenase
LAFSANMSPQEAGEAIGSTLATGADFLQVSGLPIIDTAPQARDKFITEVSSAIGNVTITGGDEASKLWMLDSATSPNASHIPYHTDNPFYEEPEEFVSFWNVRSSREGGENLILPVSRLLDWFDSRPDHSEIFQDLLSTSVLFELGSHAARGFMLDQTMGHARFDQKYIGSDFAALGQRFSSLLEEAPAHEIKLSEGAALFFNNRTVLHARTPYVDSNRLSIRVRISNNSNPRESTP